MKYRYWWVLAPLCAVAVAAVVIFVLSEITERRMAPAVARLVTQAEALMGDRLPKWAAGKGRAGAEGVRTPRTVGPRDSGTSMNDSMAAYNHLLGTDGPTCKDPSWGDVHAAIHKHPNIWTDEQRALVAAFMERNRESILALRRLAELGGPVYELDYSKGYLVDLPHLAQLGLCAQLLSADVVVHAGDADYRESVCDIVAGMRLADALSKEPILISQGYRVAMCRYLYDAIETCIQGQKLSPELYEQVIGHMSNGESRAAFARAFIGEGLMGLDAFERIRAAEPEVIHTLPQGWSIDARVVRAYESPFARPWLNTDEQAFAETVVKFADIAALPYCEAKRQAETIGAAVQALPRNRFFTRQLSSDLALPLAQEAVHEVLMDLLRIGLAAEQYRGCHDAYPPTLDTIVQVLGGTIPLDPFSGEPYAYALRDAGFVLHSADATGPAVANKRRPTRFSGAFPHEGIAWRGRK